MIRFTIYDPATMKVLAYQSTTDPGAVLLMVRPGQRAVMGIHWPADELVDEFDQTIIIGDDVVTPELPAPTE